MELLIGGLVGLTYVFIVAIGAMAAMAFIQGYSSQ